MSVQGKAFDKIMIVMFENKHLSEMLSHPYTANLTTQGCFMANSYAGTHPSQPNYIMTIAGDQMGIVNDDVPQTAHLPFHAGRATSIVDLLEAKDVSWKAYMEDLPGTFGRPGEKTDNGPSPYARRHNPFVSFPLITKNPDRMAKVVGAEQLAEDMKNDALPQYSWYTPNLYNDGHSLKPDQKPAIGQTKETLLIDNIATFLQSFLGPTPMLRFPQGTLVVLTFDEAVPYNVPNQIYTLLLGNMVNANTTETERVSHYSLLRTVEDNWGLGTLGRFDDAANPYSFLGL